MKILILAAGYGTRLYAITKDKPKALLEVNGRSLIDHIVDKLTGLPDLNEIVLVSNDKFYPDFVAWAEDHASKIPITVLNDGSSSPEDRLGSIGDIQFSIEKHGLDEDVLVVGSDNLFDYDMDTFVGFARRHSEAVSIGVYDIGEIEKATEYGVVAVDETGRITSFEEKPQQPKSSLISMCFYYLPQTTLPFVSQYLKEVGKADKAGDYIKWLCEQKEVYGFQFKGTWYDIGSVESYQEALKHFK